MEKVFCNWGLLITFRTNPRNNVSHITENIQNQNQNTFIQQMVEGVEWQLVIDEFSFEDHVFFPF